MHVQNSLNKQLHVTAHTYPHERFRKTPDHGFTWRKKSVFIFVVFIAALLIHHSLGVNTASFFIESHAARTKRHCGNEICKTIGCVGGDVCNTCTTPPLPRAELGEIQNSAGKEKKREQEKILRCRSNDVVCFRKFSKRKAFEKEILPVTGVVQVR
uniref:Uncharacterized protein n=1 Tax=Rhipicephalus zambeziensis TaxID=60191 RepID=A0A224YLT1_9ACAR